MNINDAFPSNYLKADDLRGNNIIVTISRVDLEEIGQGHQKDRKLVLSFRGKEKKLVCNKTNASTIAKHYGPETDDWVGKAIIIGPREVEFQGDMVWSIRVSLQKPTAEQAAKAGAVLTPTPSEVAADPGSEDVPF